jgi:hypothetical protein
MRASFDDDFPSGQRRLGGRQALADPDRVLGQAGVLAGRHAPLHPPGVDRGHLEARCAA